MSILLAVDICCQTHTPIYMHPDIFSKKKTAEFAITLDTSVLAAVGGGSPQAEILKSQKKLYAIVSSCTDIYTT